MSVINQVLKDLDRQGANAAPPNGVIAVNKRDMMALSAPLRKKLIGGFFIISLLVGAWQIWPLLKQSLPLDRISALISSTFTSFTSNLSFKSDPAASTGIPAQAPSPTAVSPAPIILPARNQAPAAEVTAEVSTEATMVESSSTNSSSSSSSSPPSSNSPSNQIKQPAEARPRQPAHGATHSTAATQKTESTSAVIKAPQPPRPDVQAEEAWRQALRWLEQGRNHEAKKWLENAVQLDPAHIGARQNLIALLLESGANTENAARAETLLKEGMRLHANDPWYARSLAQWQLQQADYAQAASTLESSLNSLSDATNWSLYASTLTKLGKPSEATQAYQKALGLKPDQGHWWIGLAVTLEQAGDAANAAAAYQRALQTRLNNDLREFALQKARELTTR